MPTHLAIGVGTGGLLLDGKLYADPVSCADRFLEPERVEAGIGKNRTFVGIDKQPGSKAQQQIAMGHAPREERVSLRGVLVHVCIERVTGEFREMFNICSGDVTIVGMEVSPIRRS